MTLSAADYLFKIKRAALNTSSKAYADYCVTVMPQRVYPLLLVFSTLLILKR